MIRLHEAMADTVDDLIAHNDLGEVRGCDCGGINLALGPVTLHFSADELPMLADLLAQTGVDSPKRKSTRRKRSKAPKTLH